MIPLRVRLICPLTGERLKARVLERPGKRVHIACEGVDFWVDPDELEGLVEVECVRSSPPLR